MLPMSVNTYFWPCLMTRPLRASAASSRDHVGFDEPSAQVSSVGPQLPCCWM